MRRDGVANATKKSHFLQCIDTAKDECQSVFLHLDIESHVSIIVCVWPLNCIPLTQAILRVSRWKLDVLADPSESRDPANEMFGQQGLGWEAHSHALLCYCRRRLCRFHVCESFKKRSRQPLVAVTLNFTIGFRRGSGFTLFGHTCFQQVVGHQRRVTSIRLKHPRMMAMSMAQRLPSIPVGAPGFVTESNARSSSR